jgi:hypothetical protein
VGVVRRVDGVVRRFVGVRRFTVVVVVALSSCCT